MKTYVETNAKSYMVTRKLKTKLEELVWSRSPKNGTCRRLIDQQIQTGRDL